MTYVAINHTTKEELSTPNLRALYHAVRHVERLCRIQYNEVNEWTFHRDYGTGADCIPFASIIRGYLFYYG